MNFITFHILKSTLKLLVKGRTIEKQGFLVEVKDIVNIIKKKMLINEQINHLVMGGALIR